MLPKVVRHAATSVGIIEAGMQHGSAWLRDVTLRRLIGDDLEATSDLPIQSGLVLSSLSGLALTSFKSVSIAPARNNILTAR